MQWGGARGVASVMDIGDTVRSPVRHAVDVPENLGEFDRQSRPFLEVLRGSGIRRGHVSGLAHDHHQAIEMLRHEPTAQRAVGPRLRKQFVGYRGEIGHWNPLRSIQSEVSPPSYHVKVVSSLPLHPSVVGQFEFFAQVTAATLSQSALPLLLARTQL